MSSPCVLTLCPHLVSSPCVPTLCPHLCPHPIFHHLYHNFFLYPSTCPHPLSSPCSHLVLTLCPHCLSSPYVLTVFPHHLYQKLLPLSPHRVPTLCPHLVLTLRPHCVSSQYILTVFTITFSFIPQCVLTMCIHRHPPLTIYSSCNPSLKPPRRTFSPCLLTLSSQTFSICMSYSCL